MASSHAIMSTNDDFGANNWLIEEMRERFQSDPESVPTTWREFFSKSDKHLMADDDIKVTKAQTQPAPAAARPASEPTTSAKATQSTATKDQSPAPAAAPASTPAPTKPVADEPRQQTPQAPTAPSTTPTVERVEVRTESPSQPGAVSPLGPDVPNPFVRPDLENIEPVRNVLRGAPMRTAKNMEASLTVPTATSVRAVPMKLVIENRATINNFLRRSRGGKVSFTHIIAYAMVKAMEALPEMNVSYAETDGKPTLVQNQTINLGIAIDVENKGVRQLLVPCVKNCERLNFAQFYVGYEQLVRKARNGELTIADFAGTTASITNPGGIGTNMSVPRLMSGQGVILGVGSIDYPAEFEGASEEALTRQAVSKTCTLTSTYDHRVIQGAQSGEFLKRIHQLLLGEFGFYESIFEALRIPYPPIKWARDIVPGNRQPSRDARVHSLVNAYRNFGHLQSDVDPLEYRMRSHPDLEMETHGLTLWDLEREFPVANLAGKEFQKLKLRQVLDILRDSYAHTLGIEYMHLQDPAQRKWIQDRIERAHEPRSHEDHMRILNELSEAEVFETFLQTKYVGQTRFSMEGAESALVVLSELCEKAANADFAEVAIGMPHRGRLNVLANIVGKLYSDIFREFDNRMDDDKISGDVKYHLGSQGQYTAQTGNSVLASVAANPSHLEAVNPVLIGIARAKNDQLPNPAEFRVLPVLMHGDAAFAGQGIVYETLQMSQLRAYTVGGTIHLVVNNQIGFTTGPIDARSSTYATDVAKAVQAPILHVNGDDPDACALAAEIAFDFRREFKKDVVIDMLCYRRRGHNEGDDPSFTQPLMYDLIEKKRPVRKIYTESLIGRGDISLEDAEQAVNRFRDRLEEVFANVRNPDVPREAEPYRMVPNYPDKPDRPLGTAITPEAMGKVADVYSKFPEGFNLHPKVAPQLERRADAIKNGPIDWATAEILAFGSLLMDGHRVRISGQDARRGTFSQRFGAVVDRATNEAWVPLKHLTDDQAPFDIYDSLLSEYGVMGFEYGYSVAAPDSLVCWEAQYGDFYNGAQTIVDEFISSGNPKWTQKSGVVLLLPHGYEGAGPDHSSARPERFLQACCEDNMAVCMPSTPASYFHLLRQHVQVNWHRPLVVMTPKSMLRNKLAISSPADFVGDNKWRPALPDPEIKDPSKVTTVLLCAGKLRWDLVKARAERGLTEQVAIVAVERLYPLADEALAEILSQFGDVEVRWVQEEPENQGAWEFFKLHLEPAVRARIGDKFTMVPVTRPPSASTSTGSHKIHTTEQSELIDRAFSTNL